MKKPLFLGLNLFWLLIALSPVIYGREFFAIREPYWIWVVTALILNFVASHLLILYESKLQWPQFGWKDWLGRIPLAILSIGAYLYLFGGAAWSELNLNIFNGMSLFLAVSLFIPLVFFVLFSLGILVLKPEDAEKKKRERIDSVLRDLSDEDLVSLKKRLMDGTINDESLEDALMGEDGEIVYGKQR